MTNEIRKRRCFSPEEVLELLRLELGMVADGAYEPSVRTPRTTPALLLDSPVCLNFGKGPDDTLEPCDGCWLMDFVPRERQNRLFPCYHIPLNEKGETLASLEATGDRDRLKQALLGWLRDTIAKVGTEMRAGSRGPRKMGDGVERPGSLDKTAWRLS